MVDAAWMSAHGYSTALRSQYGAAGWIKQPVRRVYQRPRGTLAWQPVVISLQTLLGYDLLVTGTTALELQGFSHYVRRDVTRIHLTGPRKPPTWLGALLPDIRFVYRNDRTLFRTLHASTEPHTLEVEKAQSSKASIGVVVQPWGQWNWPLCLSSPERAILEVLNELPDHESFHHADLLMEGLSTLSPVRLTALLSDCRNVKVKRLFFFFAERHAHAWLKRIDRKNIDLGKGKRMLVKGGRLHPKYLITVPGDLDGIQ